MENGILRETKLDPSAVFTEKLSKNTSIAKFAMPAVKEGSVLDVEYTIRSSVQVRDISWNFQNAFPCRWSEYDLLLPDASLFHIKYQGDTSYYIHDVELQKGEFDFDRGGRHVRSHFRWVKRNEPAILNEPYVFSMNNYSDKIEFQYQWIVGNPFTNRSQDSSSWDGFSAIVLFGEWVTHFCYRPAQLDEKGCGSGHSRNENKRRNGEGHF